MTASKQFMHCYSCNTSSVISASLYPRAADAVASVEQSSIIISISPRFSKLWEITDSIASPMYRAALYAGMTTDTSGAPLCKDFSSMTTRPIRTKTPPTLGAWKAQLTDSRRFRSRFVNFIDISRKLQPPRALRAISAERARGAVYDAQPNAARFVALTDEGRRRVSTAVRAFLPPRAARGICGFLSVNIRPQLYAERFYSVNSFIYELLPVENSDGV